MATHTLPILGSMTCPDGSGNVYFEQLTTVFDTSGIYPSLCLTFEDAGAADIFCYGSFQVPDAYVDTPVWVIAWTCKTGSAKVDWKISYAANADGESLIIASEDDNEAWLVTAGSVNTLNVDTVAATGTFAGSDQVHFTLERECSDTTNDTLAGSAYVLGLGFRYNDA